METEGERWPFFLFPFLSLSLSRAFCSHSPVLEPSLAVPRRALLLLLGVLALLASSTVLLLLLRCRFRFGPRRREERPEVGIGHRLGGGLGCCCCAAAAACVSVPIAAAVRHSAERREASAEREERKRKKKKKVNDFGEFRRITGDVVKQSHSLSFAFSPPRALPHNRWKRRHRPENSSKGTSPGSKVGGLYIRERERESEGR